MNGLVFICTTCDRYGDRNSDPTPGERLAAAFDRHLEVQGDTGADALTVRRVACLNGCLKPCNVALRGANRATFRFSRVQATDVPALAAFARRYWACRAGEDVAVDVPAALAPRLGLIVPPSGVPARDA